MVKYIITEQQNNRLINLIENVFNSEINNLKEMDVSNPPSWVYNYSIDASNSIEKVKVTNLDKDEDKMIIFFDVYLNTFFINPHIESVFDSVLTQIQPHLGKIYYRINEINRESKNW